MPPLQGQWLEALKPEFKKPYYKELFTKVGQEYQRRKIFPAPDDIFNAFHLTPLDQVKVVILGQDPYHNDGQAHGLCFSVKPDVEIPPSLVNIYQELHDDCGCYIPDNGYLVKWARQGVLLLNTVLTVRAHQANSHRGIGWEEFTDAAIRVLNEQDRPIVFMLWGRPAQMKKAMLNNPRHLILEAPHPSPLSAFRGFFGCRHFSKANAFLTEHGLEPIDWQIEKQTGELAYMEKKNDNTLLKNASFLMVAALVSKIIGLIYKSPLSATLGNESFGCFSFAQNVYLILLMIASYSIPQAVSKIMAERIAFKRYRDAQRIFKGALLYAVIVGGVVAVFCVVGAPILIPDSMANARLALQFLAPTIFLSGILGVFRGYFQAYRNMLPTSLSQIFEQIAVAVVALAMANFMVNYFADADTDVLRSWSAAGATMGTGAGVATALLFMLLVYWVNRKVIQKKIQRDTVSVNESYSSVMKNIVLIVSPIILSSFLYNVNTYLNSRIYSQVSGFKGMESSLIEGLYAECGYFMTLINIPLTLASTAPTSMLPEVSGAYATGNIKEAKEKINKATWLSMFISIPCSVGLFVLAGPITSLLFPATDGVAGYLMMLGVITVIMNGMSNISNGVLQGIGKAHLPMIHAAIALVIDVIVMLVLMFATDLGIYSVVIAMIVYALVMCILNHMSMRKELDYRNPWKEAYLMPFLASLPMGAAAFLIYRGVHALTRSIPGGNLIALAPAIAIGACIYFLVYLLISDPKAEDLAGLPGGRKLVEIGRKLHIIKDHSGDK